MATASSRPRFRELVLFLLFVVVATTVSMFHEFWRDELQAWMIVRDSASIADLLDNTRYEGHPSLWFLLLFGLKQIAPGAAAMKALHLCIASASAWLILRFSPFSRGHRALLVCGYFFLYEYAVIARNYAVGVFFVLVACVLFPRRASRGPFLAIALAIVGMMLANLYSFLLGVGFAFLLFADDWRRSGGFGWRRLPGYAVIAAGVLLFWVDVATPADYGYWPGWRTVIASRPLAEALARAGCVFFPIPKDDVGFWNTMFVSNMWIQAVCGAAALIAAAGIIPRKQLARWFFMFCAAALLLFSYVKFPGYLRHNGHLFVAFVAMCWIEPCLSGPERPRRRLAGALLTFILATQAIAGITASALEIAYPFSQARVTADWINRYRPQTVVIARDESGASAVAAFLDAAPYYPRSRTFGTWIRWTNRRFVDVEGKSLIQVGDSLAAALGRRALWLTTAPLDSAAAYGLRPVMTFAPSVAPLESYWLYER